MAAFEYQALDAKGKQKKGVMEGDSARQIRQQLRDKGWMPLAVEPTTEKEKKTGGFSFSRGPSLSVAERALLLRQLSTLIGAGLPIDEALKALADQSERQKTKAMVLAIRAKVTEGFTLAKAMEDFPRAFPQLFRSTVSAGEQSGNLAPVLERLAEYSERSHESAQTIRNATIYPVILVVVAVGIVVYLVTNVVPSIVDVFVKNGQELPWLTQQVLNLSHFISSYGIFVFIAAIVGGVVFGNLMRKKGFRYRVHQSWLTLPLVGRFIRDLNTARFGSTLGILTSSGVPLVEGMKIASDVVQNLPIKSGLNEATVRVTEGGSLHAVLKETGYFSPIMLHMIASGESSGELDAMLVRTAAQQEKTIESNVSAMISVFQPMALLGMAGVVALIVVAIMLPILELQQMVQ
ncbi:MAG: type II secretion system inner membrane protein GspF [Pseudomonadota bacterium]|nr:type II secretion system inner membrane protein GspF [Pseudomonadota bacterium]